MKILLSTVLLFSSLSFSMNSNAALALGLTGNPLILAPMVPGIVVMANVTNSVKHSFLAFGATYLGFFLLNENGNVSVISDSDTIESFMQEGLTEKDAVILDANREEINAGVNAVFATLNEKSTEEEVAKKWSAQKEFIGGQEVLDAYNRLGELRIQNLD